jgi:hypothetical protein
MLDGTGSAFVPGRASSLTGSLPAATPLPTVPVAGPPSAAATAALVPPDDEPGGLVVSWTGGVGLGPVLAAAHRHARHRAGLDLPAWGEAGSAGESEGRPTGDPEAAPQDDELGEEALAAASEGRGRVLPAAALGGHAIMAPGPDWLAGSRAAGPLTATTRRW